jgi:fructan beta-fructosidase
VFFGEISVRHHAPTESSYDESYRPQFHFSPAANWINDPNGLVYYNGEYHLFYQHHPHSSVWGPMHWGHAVSRDLIHWTHLPIALYPDEIGAIWSGCAVVDAENTSGLVPGGGLIAIFTYENQSQGIAYSQDTGRTWEKYSGNPVLAAQGKDFRDPKVFWHAPTNQWVMVIAASDRVKIFTSPNLIQWTYTSEFGTEYGNHTGVWECPDLFPLTVDGQADQAANTKWVLIVSVSGKGADGWLVQYFVGGFDGQTFTSDNPPETTLLLDNGPDNYAGITWNNAPDSSRIYIGWMNNWAYARDIPTAPWRGAMTIPRRLTLKQLPDGLRLAQSPVPQFESLRGPAQSWHNEKISYDIISLDGIASQTLEIVAEFSLNTASRFGFKFHNNISPYLDIGYDASSAEMFVVRYSSYDVDFLSIFAGVFRAALVPTEDRIKMRILLDWPSVEVFGGDGAAIITAQVFPAPTGHVWNLFARGGDVTVVALDIYPIRRIWPTQ